MKIRIWLAALPLVSAVAHGGESLTLKTAVERAVERNPELKALALEVEAERERAAQAGRWDDPTLDLGVLRKDEPVGRTSFGNVGLSQTIPRPGRLGARADRARARERLAEGERADQETELRARVLELLYLHRVAQEKAEHAQERVERFRTVETYLRSRPFAAPQKRAEAAIVRSKLMVLQKEWRELEANRKIAWNRLNLFLGYEREVDIRVPWYVSAPQFSPPEILDRLESRSPDLRRQSRRVEAQEAEARAERLEAWPGLALSATYSDGSGASPEKNYGLGLSFPIPAWNGNRGAIRAADARARAEESRRGWLRERVKAELSSALERYRTSAVSLAELAPEKMKTQERDMRELDAGFKRGQIDLLTYLEADGQHFESLNAILDAQVGFLASLSALLRLVGEAPKPLEM